MGSRCDVRGTRAGLFVILPSARNTFMEAVEALSSDVRLLPAVGETDRFAGFGDPVITVTDVRDSARGDELDAWHNHPGVNRGKKVVEAALGRCPIAAEELARLVKRDGGFFQHYRRVTGRRIADGMHARSDGGGWLVLVGSQAEGEAEGGLSASWRAGGHGDFLFPADKADATTVVPLPVGRHDRVSARGRSILEEIVKDPASAVLEADLCTYPHARRMGVGAAIERRLSDIADHLNTAGGRIHRIKYVVSAIARILRVCDHRGREVWRFDPPVFNEISFLMHTRRRRNPGVLIGEQRRQKIARIRHDEVPYALEGEWAIVAQRLPALRR